MPRLVSVRASFMVMGALAAAMATSVMACKPLRSERNQNTKRTATHATKHTRRQCALFFPPPQSFKPASTHREEEEVVQPVFGVERNLPCTGQIPKANTHNKQSLLSAKKFLFLDLSSLKNPYGKNNTLGSRSHRKRNNNNRSKHKHRDTETQKANQISKQNTESEKDT
jgi:hypothetical protein